MQLSDGATKYSKKGVADLKLCQKFLLPFNPAISVPPLLRKQAMAEVFGEVRSLLKARSHSGSGVILIENG
ncbi:MAG: hypothetical protein DSM106950_22520 [Stigonema ocellatum SAG 48.90 = DSM 106950]|nr:hypothetical protein [Stigonema ocellatum SAG 48.90 = DSM 106950]